VGVPENLPCGFQQHIRNDIRPVVMGLRLDGAVIIAVTGKDTLPGSGYSKAYFGVSHVGGNYPGPSDLWFDEVFIQSKRKI